MYSFLKSEHAKNSNQAFTSRISIALFLKTPGFVLKLNRGSDLEIATSKSQEQEQATGRINLCPTNSVKSSQGSPE